jgi:hypothetical protein
MADANLTDLPPCIRLVLRGRPDAIAAATARSASRCRNNRAALPMPASAARYGSARMSG